MVPVLAVPMDEMLPVLVIPEGKNPETLRKREYLEHRTQKGTESGSIRSTKPPNALSTRGIRITQKPKQYTSTRNVPAVLSFDSTFCLSPSPESIYGIYSM